MSFNQIVLKNLKQNLRHYAMYIFSLIVSIVLYFSFVTLKYTDSINNENSMAIIRKGSDVGSYFLFFIIIVFLMYANQLFIKRRTREFALFQLIGLTKSNILRMLIIEQIAMFLVTGVIGVIVGVFGSKLLLMVVLKVLHISTSVALTFQFSAVFQTCLLIFISMLLIIIQSYIFLRRRSILSMMNDSTKSEVSKNTISILEICSGILGVVMITFGYYMSTEMFSKFLSSLMFTPFIILFLTVVGAYLFFRSSVSVIFKMVKNAKRGKVSITDVVFTSSIMHRMKKNALSLTIIATISAVTVTVLCFGAISKSTIDDNVALTSPQDFNFIDNKQAESFENKMKDAHIGFDKKYKEVSEVKMSKDTFFKEVGNPNMSKSDSMLITSNKNFKDNEITGNRAKVVNMVAPGGFVQHNEKGEIVLQGQSQHTFKVIGSEKDVSFMSVISFGGPVLLVNDDKYNDLKQNASETRQQFGYNLKKQSEWKEANQIAKSVSPNIESQKMVRQSMDDSVGILLFVTSFLGLAFLVAAGCIIYIKQMDETEDEIPNFVILRKIGYTHHDMLKGLALKVTFNFGLPLIVSLLHAYFAAKAFILLMGGNSMLPVYIVMGTYSVVYCIFAIMAFVHSSRIVKHSI
ncbi:FtsX-like permease family protein [Staphylococcus shinii]|uniref:ABC transporter permease n=1 Tax=Staphylococcus shinii TaxID=2912228 RepID=A0A418IG08_9STAP|nr:ABC transporter permease [Staphylococcus shinii]MDW8563255.1 ABC transporter permease [Staphylococcus shinii]MDW8566492.1 ABC transporter permease [Staphylococcus shinii]PTI01833.1 ABC transporter permease [Staphylococcus shinii]PTI66986.1 ABC transporter permease [Staphylococcus shinii]RIN01155.1 ABC transporter permease [Staphylococcus shinii]